MYIPFKTACTASSILQEEGRVRRMLASFSLTRTLALAPHTELMVASAMVTTAEIAAQTISSPASAYPLCPETQNPVILPSPVKNSHLVIYYRAILVISTLV